VERRGRQGRDVRHGRHPASHTEAAREWRDRLLETIAEHDDEMMELYLEGRRADRAALIAAIRRATIAGKLTPDPDRLGVQEQGRSAHARRSRPLPPSPPSTSGAIEGHAVGNEDEVIKREPDKDARCPLWPSRSPATRTSASSPTSASTPAR
jgi:elongation factor G